MADRPVRQPAFAAAEKLHRSAIHLLRRVRQEDAATGLTPPRASALSVLVFGGPLTLGELAKAEQVRPPTITRLVQDMEREGLVTTLADPDDRRIKRVTATPHGRKLMLAGRDRRVHRIAVAVASLPRAERALLESALDIVAKLGTTV
jgi:DNA-binding MarR family transcriptional regulator